MPHMSPRLKMRRGRFGPGGFKGPVLKIFGGGSPFGVFTATAADDLDGDVSANVNWFVAGAGSPASGIGSPYVATGASVDLSAYLTVGSPFPGSPFLPQVVWATVTDSGGKTSTVSLTLTDSTWS